MDFMEFFPSLKANDIRELLVKAKNTGRIDAAWTHDDSELFTDLVCRFESLPIGASTSPSLSNALCFELDELLSAMAAQYDIVYTRYADDLFFSSKRANVLGGVEREVTTLVGALTQPRGLRLNTTKTKHSSRRGRQTITGIVLTPDGLSLGRKTKRRIRSQVYNLSRLSDLERASLSGWLAYCQSVEPDFINRLIMKFGWSIVREALK